MLKEYTRKYWYKQGNAVWKASGKNNEYHKLVVVMLLSLQFSDFTDIAMQYGEVPFIFFFFFFLS